MNKIITKVEPYIDNLVFVSNRVVVFIKGSKTVILEVKHDMDKSYKFIPLYSIYYLSKSLTYETRPTYDVYEIIDELIRLFNS